jgi:hypothetical protein
MESYIRRRKFLATLGGAAACRSRRARSRAGGGGSACSGRLMLTVLGGLAEFERDPPLCRSERILYQKERAPRREL